MKYKLLKVLMLPVCLFNSVYLVLLTVMIVIKCKVHKSHIVHKHLYNVYTCLDFTKQLVLFLHV